LRNSLTMFLRFLASLMLGAVMRRISHPASMIGIASLTQASVFIVSEINIVWTRIGLLPPTPTSPTFTSRVMRRCQKNGLLQ
jgi:CHASE2 domain-containing sensor protein